MDMENEIDIDITKGDSTIELSISSPDAVGICSVMNKDDTERPLSSSVVIGGDGSSTITQEEAARRAVILLATTINTLAVHYRPTRDDVKDRLDALEAMMEPKEVIKMVKEASHLLDEFHGPMIHYPPVMPATPLDVKMAQFIMAIAGKQVDKLRKIDTEEFE